MKKLLFICTLLFMGILSHAQDGYLDFDDHIPINKNKILNETIWVLDSSYFYVNDTSWVLVDRDVYGYDSFAKIQNRFSQDWDIENELWGDFRDTISYNYVDGLLDNEIQFGWIHDTQMWSDTIKFSQYSDGKLDVSLSYAYDLETQLRSFAAKSVYTYNIIGDPESKLYSVWDFETLEWVNSRFSTKIYDLNNQIVEDVIYNWDLIDQVWIPSSQFVYTFNDNDDIAEVLRNTWNNEWIGYWRQTYTYNGLEELETLYYESYNSVELIWSNYRLYNYEYDLESNLSFRNYQLWDDTFNNWRNNRQFFYSYDNNNNLIEYKGIRWLEDTEEWEDRFKYEYYYTGILIDKLYDLQVEKIQVFPNPAINQLSLMSDNVKQNDKVEIFDISGHILVSTQLLDGNSVDVSALSAGIYFAKVYSDKNTYIVKFVKQ